MTKVTPLAMVQKRLEIAIERAEKAEGEAEFFRNEVKLRNRIPATSDVVADLLRRAEKAEGERDALSSQLAEADRLIAVKTDWINATINDMAAKDEQLAAANARADDCSPENLCRNQGANTMTDEQIVATLGGER